MEKLTKQEYQMLLDLIEKERDSIRQASYTNEEVAEQYHTLGIISVKLYTQLKLEG